MNQMGKITSIKLQKAMLLADRIYWTLYKKSISGLEYTKDKCGPVMEKQGRSILKCMDSKELHTENRIEKKKV